MRSKRRKQKGVGEWMVAQMVIPVFISPFTTLITCTSLQFQVVRGIHTLHPESWSRGMLAAVEVVIRVFISPFATLITCAKRSFPIMATLQGYIRGCGVDTHTQQM